MYDQPGSDPVYWKNAGKKTKREKILEQTRKDVAKRKYFEWDDGEITNVMYQYNSVDHVMIAIEESGEYITDGVWRLDDDTFLVRDDIDPESFDFENTPYFTDTYNKYFRD